jgi:two-component system sensor histidine kinase/response regulator
MIRYIKQLHSKLIGDSDSTVLQARIFHEVCIIAMLAIPVALIINLVIKVPHVNSILITTVCIMTALYFNSRYFGNLKSSVIIFTISSGLLLVFNYFINSGINGPTLLLFVLSLVFTISLMPTRQYFFWVLFNAFIVTGLIAVEYYYPELVRNTYTNRTGQFTDIISTYLAIIACIGVVLTYLIKSQQAEKIKAMNASKALKAANDSKTRLLSILSHDLRSPLNSIQGFLEMLIDYDLAEDERKAMKKSLLKETKNTQVMLFNLLSWTKSQMDGGVKVNLVPINLHDAIEACLKIQQSAAMEKMISLKNLSDPGLHTLADLEMLKLVIRNLINNAIKFTQPGGEILIESSVQDNTVIFNITDNGVGIPPDKQQDLFSMESTSTYGTNNEKGVGLGLMLCKEFTELQGGEISFSSQLNEGTSFKLSFPLHTLKTDPALSL